MNNNHSFTIEPFYLTLGVHSLFCLFLTPTVSTPKASVLYLHPFAEEMHKSRRMAALQAREFAQAGYAVLQIDLIGCGDSSGDFADARWETWLESAQAAYHWLKQKLESPIILWGLRLGATLAVDLSAQCPEIAGLLLWQPVINGENYLTQFLRIKVASEMFAERKTGVKELRELLSSGESVEVGGYLLAPALCSSLDKIRLAELPISVPAYWFEVTQNPTPEPSPASAKVIAAWVESGINVYAQTVVGDIFWATQEIMECPNLLAETSNAMANIVP
jgi:exosortase A-associated hydrolase 2